MRILEACKIGLNWPILILFVEASQMSLFDQAKSSKVHYFVDFTELAYKNRINNRKLSSASVYVVEMLILYMVIKPCTLGEILGKSDNQ